MESPEILLQKNGPQRGATISRRNFVRTLAAVSAAAPARLSWTGQVFGAENSSRTPVGSNIYGWGQYYQRMGKNVGEHLDEVLSALRDADYDYLEAFVDSNQPDKNAELAERMKAKGLKPVCLYMNPADGSRWWKNSSRRRAFVTRPVSASSIAIRIPSAAKKPARN
jgi:hypothetical protein